VDLRIAKKLDRLEREGVDGVPADLSRTSTVLGAVSDLSQLVGGVDSELTMKTMILFASSNGDGRPASCRPR
jgi:hypothetical protein